MNPTPKPPHYRGLLLLAAVLAAAVFLFPLVLARQIPLLDPDEGLHAAIAQEMVERGDWVVPRLLGKPFLDKPILYFWAEAASLRLLGPSELAVRLPGLMFGLLGAVTTAAVAWRMFGRAAGLLAAMFYTTMILPTALAQAAAHDVALVPWVNLALLLFWEADRAATRRAALGCTVAVGLVLGLAILTKGFAGVALVGMAYGSYLLIARRLTWAACLRGAVALLIAAAVAAPWYWAVERGNPGYLRYYFIERHLLGFATATQSHGGRPWWYYLPILLGGGLPWIAYLPVVARDAVPRRWDPIMLVWCWLIGCTLLLSLASSKMLTYIWPVFPAVAILAAVAWARLLDGTLSAPARRWLAGNLWLSCAVGPLVLPIVLLVVQRLFAVHFPWPAWAAVLAASAAAAVPLAFWMAHRCRAAVAAATLAVAAQFLAVMTAVLPTVAAGLSARDLAAYCNARGEVPPKLLIADERIGSVIFYLDAELRAGLREGQLESVSFAELGRGRPIVAGAVVALPERQVPRAARTADLTGVSYQQAGRYRLYRAADLTNLRHP